MGWVGWVGLGGLGLVGGWVDGLNRCMGEWCLSAGFSLKIELGNPISHGHKQGGFVTVIFDP